MMAINFFIYRISLNADKCLINIILKKELLWNLQFYLVYSILIEPDVQSILQPYHTVD